MDAESASPVWRRNANSSTLHQSLRACVVPRNQDIRLKVRGVKETYPLRVTNLSVIDTGLEESVNTYIIMSPTIYGIGSGLFNRQSIQIPTMIRQAIKRGAVDVLGPGSGVWDAVHIADVATLYEVLLSELLSGAPLPSGKQGIFFSETSDHTWRELSAGLAVELHNQGVLNTAEVNQLGLQDWADVYAAGNTRDAELGYASNARSRADKSRKWGWRPLRTKEDFLQSFKEEIDIILLEGEDGSGL